MAIGYSAERAVDRVFLTPRGRPRLVDGAVLFIDLLGVREMSRSRGATSHLVALERAVSKSYRTFLSPHSTWSAAFFSDTLVLAAPVVEHGKTAIRNLLTQAVRLQLELVAAGFFMRGGLSLGKIHLRNGIVFGPALVDAYELESRVAVHPRIVLSHEVEQLQRSSLHSGDSQEAALQSRILMCDDDGRTFINYLGQALDRPEDPTPTVERHRDAIITRLIAHSTDKRLWEKYRWLAEYHNAVVRREMPRSRDILVPSSAMTWQFKAFA